MMQLWSDFFVNRAMYDVKDSWRQLIITSKGRDWRNLVLEKEGSCTEHNLLKIKEIHSIYCMFGFVYNHCNNKLPNAIFSS